ncbi:MAG: hypothetical protein CL705_03595 [Chloroflexi bacterium]|nr:hypothetical protein [Chloroflexota bacterium]
MDKNRDFSSVGIIVNPLSGKDIRRLVASASVVSTHMKSNEILKLYAGLAAYNIKKVYVMPDYSDISRRAREQYSTKIETILINTKILDAEETTIQAAKEMEAKKVGCIIVFGGDGTCRLVSKHLKETPILPVSTGTNNLFPLNLEGTVAGIAAAKFCLLKNLEKYSNREKKLEIFKNNELVDSSLVDVVISKTPYIGSRAIWDINNVDEIFISKVSHEGIGFSSIGYSLIKKGLSFNRGVHISLGQNDYGNPKKIMSAIAPGKIEEIEILGWKEFSDNKKISVKLSSGTVALDGERTIEFNPSQKISVKLNIDGPYCLKVKEILSA